MTQLASILVPMDFSAHSKQAFEYAVDFADKYDSTLHLVNVVHVDMALGYPGFAVPGAASGTPTNSMKAIRSSLEASLAEVARPARDRDVKVEIHVIEGPTATEIREVALRVGADLIVMGTHGRGGIAHALLGSVAERTLRIAPCPVITLNTAP